MLEHLATYALAYVLAFTALCCAYLAWDDRQTNKYLNALDAVNK